MLGVDFSVFNKQQRIGKGMLEHLSNYGHNIELPSASILPLPLFLVEI